MVWLCWQADGWPGSTNSRAAAGSDSLSVDTPSLPQPTLCWGTAPSTTAIVVLMDETRTEKDESSPTQTQGNTVTQTKKWFSGRSVNREFGHIQPVLYIKHEAANTLTHTHTHTHEWVNSIWVFVCTANYQRMTGIVKLLDVSLSLWNITPKPRSIKMSLQKKVFSWSWVD